MATYYVRTDGNDSNTGLGTTTLLAWRTIGKALGATGISSGDTVYVAPGVYASAITVNMTSATADTFIIGNATASLFTGISAGPIIVTNFDTTLTTTGFTGNILTATSKNYLSWQNINFKCGNTSTIRCTTSRNWSFTNCTFYAKSGLYPNEFTPPAAQPFNTTFTNCVFSGGIVQFQFAGTSNLSSQITDTSSFINCYFTGHQTFALVLIYTGGFSIRNCTIIGNGGGIYTSNNSTSFPTIVRNCLINTSGTDLTCLSGANAIVEDYNRLLGTAARSNVVASSPSNTSVSGDLGLDLMDSVLNGIGMLQPYTPYALSPNRGFGVTSGSPATDMYGVTWTNATPDAGSATYRLTSSVGQYNPTERNASAITIAPASTSQSIELYLGATGLTFATSGLAAYYVRNQAAPVAITLVTQTPTGAWASGGFAEISSSLVPGVYRLDVPNAAFAAGASDVTIVVRGASGTNGAVLTVTLSSGGLTAAQTAAAVWDEARASHTTAGTFGQYVNAELVTPVTSAALVRMGPFEVRADGLGASDPLDLQTGAQHGIDIQCVDNNGAGIDITSATVTAKVYNSGATLVDTYACTATYAADGRATFTIDTTVTNTPGTYTATITRTTGASDTQVFGPLRIYVRDI